MAYSMKASFSIESEMLDFGGEAAQPTIQTNTPTATLAKGLLEMWKVFLCWLMLHPAVPIVPHLQGFPIL